jgi:hypothetical protein
MEWLKTEVRLVMHFYPSNNVPLYLHYMIIPYAKHAASAPKKKAGIPNSINANHDHRSIISNAE